MRFRSPKRLRSTGGETGGRQSRKGRTNPDWSGRSALRQVEAAAVASTPKDWAGKRQRPFADLCLTTWLRRRET